ncbi:PAS domain-containing protein, partial [Echinicola sediminis]
EKKDGSKIWTRFALSKVSAEGKVYYLALVRDASVEMAQKEQTRQLIIAVDHLDRPVIVLDPERHIVQCNRAFTEMFGASYRYSGAGVGYQVASVVGGGFTPFIAAALITYFAGNWHSVAIYLLAGCLISAMTALLMKDNQRS